MPIYDYRCSRCGHRFSSMTTIDDRKNVSCPECKSKETELLITGCSFNTAGCDTGSDVPAGGG